MSDAITIITPKSLDEVTTLSRTLSKSALLPEALRGKEAEILMTIMTGAELGLAPMQSIRAIDVIKGKPTLKAEAMTALVRARRDVCEYLIIKHSDATRCTMETKRVGDPSATTMSFTADDAKAAGLMSNDNYKRFGAAMLRARCGSAICKAVYSDLMLGVYDSDEIEREAPRDVTPPRPTPPNVIDSTATVESSERTALEAAVAAANSEAELTALVERITRLAAADKAKVRAAWGARRDELRNAALALAAAPVQSEAVPS